MNRQEKQRARAQKLAQSAPVGKLAGAAVSKAGNNKVEDLAGQSGGPIQSKIIRTVGEYAVGKLAKAAENKAQDSWQHRLQTSQPEQDHKNVSRSSEQIITSQVSIDVNAAQQQLIDALLNQKSFRNIKQLREHFQSPNDFYALIMERKLSLFFEKNSNNTVLSKLASAITPCLENFYQALTEKMSQTSIERQKPMQSLTAPIEQTSISDVKSVRQEKKYQPQPNLSYHQITATEKQANDCINALASYIYAANAQRSQELLDALYQYSPSIIEERFKLKPKQCEMFLAKITTLQHAPSNLVNVLNTYRISKTHIESLARDRSTKQMVYNHLITLPASEKTRSLLVNCLINETSLNQFLKVKTGKFRLPWGSASKKLKSIMIRLNELPTKETTNSIVLHRALTVGQETPHQTHNTSSHGDNVDAELSFEDASIVLIENCFDHVSENMGAYLLLLALLAATIGCFYKMSQVDVTDEALSTEPTSSLSFT